MSILCVRFTEWFASLGLHWDEDVSMRISIELSVIYLLWPIIAFMIPQFSTLASP